MAHDIMRIYDQLLARYGARDWWPAGTPYEVIVGAVLTQNTAWHNVERAIANFNGDLTPERVAALNTERLAELIRPSGFLNQKASYLQNVTRWYERYGYDALAVRRRPPELIRRELLALKGVGKETADSILLYAFEFPVFVVDAYTKRLCTRLPIDANPTYDTIQAYFASRLPHDAPLFNNYHALIVEHAKTHCRAKPLCAGCPLFHLCAHTQQTKEDPHGL